MIFRSSSASSDPLLRLELPVEEGAGFQVLQLHVDETPHLSAARVVFEMEYFVEVFLQVENHAGL